MKHSIISKISNNFLKLIIKIRNKLKTKSKFLLLKKWCFWKDILYVISIILLFFQFIAIADVKLTISRIFTPERPTGSFACFGGNSSRNMVAFSNSGPSTNKLYAKWSVAFYESVDIGWLMTDLLDQPVAFGNSILCVSHEINEETNSYVPVLVSVNANLGNIEWRWQGSENNNINGPPLIHNNKVYIGTREAFYCLDIVDGSEIWANYEINIFNPLIEYDNLLYGTSNNSVFCLNPTDDMIIWKIDNFPNPEAVSVLNGIVAITGLDMDNKNAFCGFVDAKNGELLYNIKFPWENQSITYPVLSVIDEQLKALFCFGEWLYCVDYIENKVSWKFSQHPNNPVTPPAIYDGKAYLCDGMGFYCVNIIDGSVIWKYEWKYAFGGLGQISRPLIIDKLVVIASWTSVRALSYEDGRLIWSVNKSNLSSQINEDEKIRYFSNTIPIAFNHSIYLQGNNTLTCFSDQD